MNNTCPVCGKSVENGIKFCPTCGTEIKHEQKKKKDTSKLAIVLLCVLLVVVSVLATIFIMNKKNGGNSTVPEKQTTTAADHNNDDKMHDVSTTKRNPVTTSSKPAADKTTVVHTTKPVAANDSVAFDQYDMNIFLSNLTEVGFGSFSGEPSMQDIADLAIDHVLLNDTKSVSGEEYGEWYINGEWYSLRFKSSYISDLAKRFFAVNYSYVTLPNVVFKDGYCYIVTTGGEFSEGIAIVKSMKKNGNGSYTVEFDIYDAGGNDQKYYKYTPSQAESTSALRKTGYGYAILRDHTYNGKSFYRIVEYVTDRF